MPKLTTYELQEAIENAYRSMGRARFSAREATRAARKKEPMIDLTPDELNRVIADSQIRVRIADLDDADRLAAVRNIAQKSTKALHDIILAKLETCNGCCMDVPDEREQVASAILAVLASL